MATCRERGEALSLQRLYLAEGSPRASISALLCHQQAQHDMGMGHADLSSTTHQAKGNAQLALPTPVTGGTYAPHCQISPDLVNYGRPGGPWWDTRPSPIGHTIITVPTAHWDGPMATEPSV